MGWHWITLSGCVKGGFIDVSKLRGCGLDWEQVKDLPPLEQTRDEQGNFLFRTNSRYMRKLRHGRHCMLEVSHHLA